MRRALAVWVFAILGASCSRGPRPRVTLEVKDITPKFLLFYEAASKPGVDEDERWKLWKAMYGFAAVPPTEAGNAMARSMLDAAWPKFAVALPTIRKGVGAIHPPPAETLEAVAKLLHSDVPIRVRLVAAVGDFEGNAYTAPGSDGVPAVSVEVEDPSAGTVVAHEFTHAVEAEQAGLSLDWKRTIAHTIFVEGLAMRAVQAIHPGLTDADYVGELSPNWYARCVAARGAILSDIAPHLAASDEDSVMRYTMGKGGAGVEREAYYTGWLVVGDMLKNGWTFARLARVKDEQMVELVQSSLKRMQ